MAVAPPPGWLAAAAFVAAVQLAAAARLFLRSRRRAPDLKAAPAACVIVPFKGPARPQNVAAFLKQDYPGPLRHVFVVASADDPALAALPKEHVLISGAVPTRSSEKSLNLAAGAAAAGDAELLLFADADVRVKPDWARRLAAALEEPGATVATAALLPAHEGGAALMRAAWFAAGLTWFEPLTIAVGQTLAIRRRDFDALGVARLLEGAVSDDLALSNAVYAAGGRCVLAPAAAPEGRGGGWGASVEQFSRWMTLFRRDMPRVWWPGLLAVAVKAGALWQAFSAPWCPSLALLVLGGDALTVFVAACALDTPRRAALVALASPALLVVHVLNYAVSAFHHEIVWAGWTYHLDPPAAEKGEEAARRVRRRRLGRLALAVLGGAAAGMAFWPGRWGWLAWVGFIPLLVLIEDERPARAFAWGLLFGCARWLTGLPWMGAFLDGFLGAGPPETAAWLGGLAGTQSLRWGAVAALAAWLPQGRAVVFVCAAATFERWLPAVFPEPLAYTQLFDPAMVQSLRHWPGLPAVLILAVNAALLALARKPRGLQAVASCAVLAAAAGNWAWGRVAFLPPRDGSSLVVAGLQGFDDHQEYLARTPRSVDLAVWPESVFKDDLAYPPAAPVPLLLTARRDRKNVAALVLPDGTTTSAEKETLVPFGEYMPAPLSFLRALSPRTQDLVAGAPSGPLTLPRGAKIGTLVCYENLRPERARRLAEQGALLLVVQASSSWSDDPRAGEMHARFGALRALETGRPLLHVADRGPSVLFGPDGREVSRLDAGESGALLLSIPLTGRAR